MRIVVAFVLVGVGLVLLGAALFWWAGWAGLLCLLGCAALSVGLFGLDVDRKVRR